MVRSTNKSAVVEDEVVNLEGQEEILPGLAAVPDPEPDAGDEEAKVTDDDSDWDQLTENQKKARLRGRAQQTLLNNRRDEYNEIAKALFEEKGMVFQRKLTAKERAAQEVRRLIEEHGLRSEFPGFVAAASEAEPPEGTLVR